MHVIFDESHLRNVGKHISFCDAGVSSEDIHKGTEEGIDLLEAMKPREEEDDKLVKEKEESPNEIDNLIFLGRLLKTIHSKAFLETSPKV